MSHIPTAAMPHAKPTHGDGDDAAPAEKDAKRAAGGSGWGLAAALAGGALAIGAAAAAAVPLIRGRAAPKKERRDRKAHKASAKAAKPAPKKADA